MRTAFIKHHLLNVHTQEILHAKTTVITYKTSGFRIYTQLLHDTNILVKLLKIRTNLNLKTYQCVSLRLDVRIKKIQQVNIWPNLVQNPH